MSRALDLQISAIDHILSNRLVDAETATQLSGAKGSLQFLLKHEDGIRAYIAELNEAKKSPIIQAALREFPDAEIIGVRKV